MPWQKSHIFSEMEFNFLTFSFFFKITQKLSYAKFLGKNILFFLKTQLSSYLFVKSNLKNIIFLITLRLRGVWYVVYWHMDTFENT